MFLLLTLNRKIFIGRAFPGYDIHIMYYKLLHRFASNSKALLSTTRTNCIIVKKRSIGMFKKEVIFYYFYGMVIWAHSRRCFIFYQISFVFILCLFDQAGWRAYSGLAFGSEIGWTKININTLVGLARRKLCECVYTNLN